MCIDPGLKIQLMPSIGAISVIGKLVVPVILAALYKTSLGILIEVGFCMILAVASMPPLIWLRKMASSFIEHMLITSLILVSETINLQFIAELL